MRGQTQPPLGAVVDLASPWARGLVARWIWHGSIAAPQDLTLHRGHLLSQGTPGPQLASGQAGLAAQLDGTVNRYYAVAAGDSALLGPLNAAPERVSFLAWVRRSVTGVTHPIFSSIAGPATPRYYVGVGSPAGANLDKLCFATPSSGGGGTGVVGATTLGAARDYQLVVTRNGINVAFYVNGVPDGTGALSASTTDTGQKSIGQDPRLPSYFNGLLYHMAIYNRVLSAAEVAYLYAHPFADLRRPLSLRVRPVAGGISGEGAVTLGALSSAGTGTLALAATGAVTLGALSSAGTGTLALAATGAVTLGALTSTGTGTLALAATGAVTLGALTSTGTGTLDLVATGATTLGALTSTGTGTLVSGISGEGAVTLAALTSAGTSTLDLAASGATTFGALTSAGTGTVALGATGATTLASLTSAAAGTLDLVATGAVTLGAMTSTGTGTLGTPIVGTGAVTLGALTSAGAGTLNISATGATTFAPMTSAGACALAIAAAGAAAFGALVSTGQGALVISAAGAITFAALAGAGTGSAGGLVLVDSRTYVVPTAGAVREVAITAPGDWVKL